MENDKGLELSLGLACGGSSSNSKDKTCNSADTKSDTDERTSKILNDFKNFLNAGIPQTFQRSDPPKPQENFLNGQVLGDKRKSTFDDARNQKKQETETRSSDLQDKGKTSHISITTDEGSTADNEDVADSEAETSRVTSPVGSGSSSQAPKESHGKASIGASRFPVLPLNTLNVPYSITIKESPAVSGPNTSTYPLPGPHSSSPVSVPMTFGYSPVQLPVLDKDISWGMVARPQSLHSPYAGRPISTSAPTQVTNASASDAVRPDIRPSEQFNGQTNQPATEEGSSCQSEDDAKGRENSFPSEFPSIRPGIAADVKFGGSGSFPNLPWVSTTGPGPNGKTISGVTYKFNANQIKIVCACHGTHMSPEEFVQHASQEQPSPVSTAPPGLAAVPTSNPAASARG